MSRFIQSFDIEAPDVPMLKTLELDFTYDSSKPYGGLNTETFPLDAFPWLWSAKMNDSATADPAVGRIIKEIQEQHLGMTRLEITPSESYRQLVINRESQYYVRRFEQAIAENDLSALVYHGTDNALTFNTRRTPAAFRDRALGNLDAYEIVSFNAGNRSVRVKGRRYDRTEPSQDGVYVKGFYRGLNPFLRDMLNSDAVHRETRWQFDIYDYGHARLTSQNLRVTYDRIVDDQAVDPFDSSSGDTYHTIYLRESLSTSDYPSPGQTIQLFRRLPFVSGMLTTAHTFSQQYWMLDVEVELAYSFWQFFAIFGWSMFQETTDGMNWNQSEEKKKLKDRETDVLENPAGDPRWRFHNVHAPHGGQYNMAEKENRTPLMTQYGKEWDSDYSQQHQLKNSLGGLYTQRSRIRQYWWPPGNSAGKPGNSLEWYLQVPDGRFMRIGGCLAPAFWSGQELTHNQIFLNGGAYGDFTRGLEYIYGGGATSSPDVRDFVNKVYRLDVYQFVGWEAGGSGCPGPSGKFVSGKGPTPGDVSGNSGSGIVQEGGVPGGGGVPDGGGGSTPITPFSKAVDIIALAGNVVVPEVGKPYPLSSRLIRNSEGFGTAFDYTVAPSMGYDAEVSLLTTDGSQAELTFTSVPASTATTGVLLEKFVKVVARETSGAGTAPVIRGESDILSSSGDVPDSGDSGGGQVVVEGNPSISINSAGPVVSGYVTDIPNGAQLSIQVNVSKIFYATVTESGSFSFSDFGTDYNAQRYTITYRSPDNTITESSPFFYNNEPDAPSGVQIVRYSTSSVSAGGVTVFLGLSENRPARIRFGTSEGSLTETRIITSDNSQGLDNGVPHIYEVTDLTQGTTYYFQVDDHVGGSYSTSVIPGTPSTGSTENPLSLNVEWTDSTPNTGRTIVLNNIGSSLDGSTHTFTFSDDQAVDGVTRYDIWIGNTDYSNSVVAPATSITATNLPTNIGDVVITLRPPAGYTEDEFDYVTGTFTTYEPPVYTDSTFRRIGINTGAFTVSDIYGHKGYSGIPSAPNTGTIRNATVSTMVSVANSANDGDTIVVANGSGSIGSVTINKDVNIRAATFQGTTITGSSAIDLNAAVQLYGFVFSGVGDIRMLHPYCKFIGNRMNSARHLSARPGSEDCEVAYNDCSGSLFINAHVGSSSGNPKRWHVHHNTIRDYSSTGNTIQLGFGYDPHPADYYNDWLIEYNHYDNINSAATNSIELISFKSSGSVAINNAVTNCGSNEHFANRNGNYNALIGTYMPNAGVYCLRLFGTGCIGMYNYFGDPNGYFLRMGHEWWPTGSSSNANYEQSKDCIVRHNVIKNASGGLLINQDGYDTHVASKPPSNNVHKDNLYLGAAPTLQVNRQSTTNYDESDYLSDNPQGGIDGNPVLAASGATWLSGVDIPNAFENPVTIANGRGLNRSLTIDPAEIEWLQALTLSNS